MLLKIFLLVQLSYLQRYVGDFHFLLLSSAHLKKETIPCVVHELSNLIIINSDYTVMTEQKVSIGLSLHKRTKAIEMLQWFADILIDILIPLKSSWPSRSSFSWSIVFVQHIVDSSDLLTSNKHDNNTCFLVLPISIFSLLRTRPSATWGKIYSIIYLLPREEAWLHRNLYHNSIKGTVILLKIFLFVQLSIPAALRLWLSLPPVFAGSSAKKEKKKILAQFTNLST